VALERVVRQDLADPPDAGGDLHGVAGIGGLKAGFVIEHEAYPPSGAPPMPPR